MLAEEARLCDGVQEAKRWTVVEEDELLAPAENTGHWDLVEEAHLHWQKRTGIER